MGRVPGDGHPVGDPPVPVQLMQEGQDLLVRAEHDDRGGGPACGSGGDGRPVPRKPVEVPVGGGADVRDVPGLCVAAGCDTRHDLAGKLDGLDWAALADVQGGLGEGEAAVAQLGADVLHGAIHKPEGVYGLVQAMHIVQRCTQHARVTYLPI